MAEKQDNQSSDSSDSLKETLLDLESQAWKAMAAGQAADHYGNAMVDEALMVVPSNVLTRDEALKSWDSVDPWSEYELQGGKFMQLSDDCALITYGAVAKREQNDTAYSAQFTSVYRMMDGEWKLAFHQQTPNLHPIPLPPQ